MSLCERQPRKVPTVTKSLTTRKGIYSDEEVVLQEKKAAVITNGVEVVLSSDENHFDEIILERLGIP